MAFLSVTLYYILTIKDTSLPCFKDTVYISDVY